MLFWYVFELYWLYVWQSYAVGLAVGVHVLDVLLGRRPNHFYDLNQLVYRAFTRENRLVQVHLRNHAR